MGSNPSRPNITAAQVIGLLVAGVPIAATLLHAFGVYDLTREQQDALQSALTWAAAVAGTLFVADAGLRAARNHAVAKTPVAQQTPGSWPSASFESSTTQGTFTQTTPPAPKPRTRPRKKPTT